MVGTVAIAVGTLPGGYGFPPYLSIPIGAAVLYFVLRQFGRRADAEVHVRN